jgi:peptidoglycan/xylan/chitin deacetylase (PgdA/CDA1 family)
MYHSVSVTPSGHRHPYFETNVTPERFAEQIRFLADRGYRTLTMSETVKRLTNHAETRDAAVAITFDDGYADFYSAAWPILQSAGMTATVFLPTAFIRAERRSIEERPCLTWDETRRLSSAGIEIGSHTVSHPQLWDVDEETLVEEVRESKTAIEKELGRPCLGFSYPYAFPGIDLPFRKRLGVALVKAGYAWGVTTTIATASRISDRYVLPRLPVNERDTADLLAAKLTGAYDWLGRLQSLKKSVKVRRHTERSTDNRN